jgi:hypothetical protein
MRARADIESATLNDAQRRGGRNEIGLDSVGDKGELACLMTIAVDLKWQPRNKGTEGKR